MKILLINPNTSASMTRAMNEVAASVVAPDVQVHAATASRGVPYISSRAEAQMAGAMVLEMIADHGDGCDAVVIGAFGDPGLVAAREFFDVPICAMAESAMLAALMLGKTFAFITFSQALVAWYEDAVALAGLADRCVGIFVPDVPFASVATVRDDLEEAIAALSRSVATMHRADVIVLAGAPLVGLADRIADQVPVPLVDPLGAALGHAQTLVRLRVRAATTGRFARPPAKAVHGAPPALAARFEHRDPIVKKENR